MRRECGPALPAAGLSVAGTLRVCRVLCGRSCGRSGPAGDVVASFTKRRGALGWGSGGLGGARRHRVPAPPPLQAGPTLASAFRYVAGTGQAEPVAAGARRAAELAVLVLVGPRCARHALAGLSAEVGTRLAGHCRGKAERLLVAEVRSGDRVACLQCLKPRLCPMNVRTIPEGSGVEARRRHLEDTGGLARVLCFLRAALLRALCGPPASALINAAAPLSSVCLHPALPL